MINAARKAIGWALAAALAAWAARLAAHSKVPPPEGRWRELDPEELS